ncbi:hypothetical protein DL766_008142 [Monosporascus sp. MC13-8B]|uniref:Uncharacterized protein n=1 Tax=Monosporascus cannonballus TaxID=155416 RepID=A0ABY0H4R8_9PEZI|nr:hypothetical protein DL762_005493 [Monosporascus cannonballus]RYP20662.1 hypothetical protein DL766_008142 [Monosporascus sp. MC13-8B]
MNDNSTAAMALQEALGKGPIEFTIGSNSKKFGRLKLILEKRPVSTQNLNSITKLRSESSSSSASITSTSSPYSSSSTSAPLPSPSPGDSRLNLSEIALAGMDLSEMTNTWSGESEATSISTPPPSTPKRDHKGKGKDWPVGDPRRLQPHYRSLFEN